MSSNREKHVIDASAAAPKRREEAEEPSTSEGGISGKKSVESPPAKNGKREKRMRRKSTALSYDKKTSISDEVMVEFRHVTKTFHLYKNDFGRVLNLFGKPSSRFYAADIDANKDLSFTIRRGEGVAFLGKNGAGKSTALKMITGVMTPTSGEIIVNGRVSALLELSAGFDGKLTGRENLDLRGQIMGMSRKQIAEIMPGVIEFANLGPYIDQPIKTYSSGMKSRLGFSFAVASNPEILIVDEALSVGDKTFKRKCKKRVHEIITNENVTVLFVTHSSSAAKSFCSRGIVLEHGHQAFEGDIEAATEYYESTI